MMIARALAAMLLFTLDVSPRAFAQSEPASRTIAGNQDLTGPATWVYDALTFENGSTVRTNGFPLTITILGRLDVKGEATISSFEHALRPPKPADAPAAPDGRGFDPGPNSEGSGAPGPSGQPGVPGTPGAQGADGQTPAPIALIVVGTFDGGTLRIVNRGGNGGTGGNGGNGGNGGSGGQGQRAASNRVFGGVVLGCARGPGAGGAGGPGGAAGAGGPGGAAGSGGDITVVLKGEATGSVVADSPPGMPGEGGRSGQPGRGGIPGFGGRGSAGCEGRETDRRGAAGVAGAAASDGGGGANGQNGMIDVRPASLLRKE